MSKLAAPPHKSISTHLGYGKYLSLKIFIKKDIKQNLLNHPHKPLYREKSKTSRR